MTAGSVARLKERAHYFRRIALDPRTPRTSKFLILAALAYLASPIDLIPDFIPVLGQLDDILIVPALIGLALRLVPPAVKNDARTTRGKAQADRVGPRGNRQSPAALPDTRKPFEGKE